MSDKLGKIAESDKSRDLQWNIECSIRYHDRQQRFFGKCHNLVVLATTFFGFYYAAVGLGQFYMANSYLWMIGAPGVVIIFLGLCDVVFNFAGKEALHSEIRRRFNRANRKLISAISDADINVVRDDFYDIKADEPPTLYVLDTICHNDMLRLHGFPWKQQIKIKWYQRLFANFMDIQQHLLHSKNQRSRKRLTKQ